MAAAIIAALQIGTSFVASMREQDAIESQAEAQQEEYVRQMEEEERQRRQEASDAKREHDKRIASAIAGMEAMGGAGSANAARVESEIAGEAALDLARISENSKARQGVFESRIRATRKDASLAIASSQANFMKSAMGAGSSFLSLREQKKANDADLGK